MEKKELTFEDYVETIFMLKALTIELSNSYIKTGNEIKLNMLRRNCNLLSKLESNLEIKSLDAPQALIMRMLTKTEIEHLILVDVKEQELKNEN